MIFRIVYISIKQKLQAYIIHSTQKQYGLYSLLLLIYRPHRRDYSCERSTKIVRLNLDRHDRSIIIYCAIGVVSQL